ncbi:hypothetical protein ACVBEF_16580 [Glaciimonas sp. GG7]
MDTHQGDLKQTFFDNHNVIGLKFIRVFGVDHLQVACGVAAFDAQAALLPRGVNQSVNLPFSFPLAR